MFRITEDPSSGSLVQCLTKNCSNGSIVSVDMDKVGVMAAYCDPLCVWAAYFDPLCVCVCDTHTHKGSEYAAITPTMSMSTDTKNHSYKKIKLS